LWQCISLVIFTGSYTVDLILFTLCKLHSHCYLMEFLKSKPMLADTEAIQALLKNYNSIHTHIMIQWMPEGFLVWIIGDMLNGTDRIPQKYSIKKEWMIMVHRMWRIYGHMVSWWLLVDGIELNLQFNLTDVRWCFKHHKTKRNWRLDSSVGRLSWEQHPLEELIHELVELDITFGMWRPYSWMV